MLPSMMVSVVSVLWPLGTLAGWGAPMSGPDSSGEDLKLIAHRGGVVDDTRIENSLPAIEAAVDRGYWMIEVDIREARDGTPVVHHDWNFRRFYEDPRRLADLSWEEIAELRSTVGSLRPLRFDEFADACAGRIYLMLDTKGPDHPTEFFEQIEQALREHNLLGDVPLYVIGTSQSKAFFRGRGGAKIGANRTRIREALEAGEDVEAGMFLFEHGRDLDEETVRWCQSLGVDVVPSVNLFHYNGLDDPMGTARSDLERLRALGVTMFQIDSIYDSWLLESR